MKPIGNSNNLYYSMSHSYVQRNGCGSLSCLF